MFDRLQQTLPVPPFTGWDFTDTPHATAKEKAEFANWLIRFVEAGCPRSRFHKTKYQRLSNLWGHIAHYNVHGFYDEWFENVDAQTEWCQYVVEQTSYWGTPAQDWSDVEQAIAAWLIQTGRAEKN